MVGCHNRERMDQVADDLDREIQGLADARDTAAGYRIAIRRALGLALRYRREEGRGRPRERACILQALEWRVAARTLATPALARPGLARAEPRTPALNSGARSGGTRF